MLCAEQCGKEEEERWRGGGCEGRRVRGEEGERERGGVRGGGSEGRREGGEGRDGYSKTMSPKVNPQQHNS